MTTHESDEPTHNKTLQTDEIRASRGRKPAAYTRPVLRTEAAGGSCSLATTSDTLNETL